MSKKKKTVTLLYCSKCNQLPKPIGIKLWTGNEITFTYYCDACHFEFVRFQNSTNSTWKAMCKLYIKRQEEAKIIT